MKRKASKTVPLPLFLIAIASLSCRSTGTEGGPTPLTSETLARAAVAAGFHVREADADVPAAAHSRFTFTTLDCDAPRLKTLREKYSLRNVIEEAPEEWTAQLLLKEWVHRAIPGGNPKVDARTALDILEFAARGETFYCTHYAITYTECALALGWQCRKIGVDRKHGPEGLGSTHHGVAEVWSNQFRKWVVIDPQSNLHFEKGGIPLSGWEIRAEWLKDGGAAVDHVVGVPPHSIKKNPAIVWWDREGEDETATYFWLYVENQAVRAEEEVKYIFPQDDANEGLLWYQNDYSENRSRPHTGYRRDRFLSTRRLEDAYWTVGIIEPTVKGTATGEIRLSLESHAPDPAGYEFSMDGGIWKAVEDPAMVWYLKRGRNSLGLRTVSRGGVTGPEATLRLVLE